MKVCPSCGSMYVLWDRCPACGTRLSSPIGGCILWLTVIVVGAWIAAQLLTAGH